MQHLTDYYILYLLLICRIFLKYGTGNVMNNTTYGTFTADLIRHLLHTVSLYVLFDTARSRLFYLTFLSLSRIVYL